MINNETAGCSQITLTAFRWVPPFARGLVRDLRVRWALEEAGLPYTVKLIGPEDQNSHEYRAWQPFGQVPAFEQDGIAIFESAAIVQHIAEQSSALMPVDAVSRARIKAWLFAAMNSVEPFVQQLASIDLFYKDQAWTIERRPQVEAFVQRRLASVAEQLGDNDYLVGNRFSAADLLMVTVLKILRHTDLVAQLPKLKAYYERCEARPAYQKALAGQMADFVEAMPTA